MCPRTRALLLGPRSWEQLYEVAPVLPLTCETLNQIILIGS